MEPKTRKTTKEMDQRQQSLLRDIPGVDTIMQQIGPESEFADVPRTVLVRSIRSVLQRIRKQIIQNGGQPGQYIPGQEAILAKIKSSVHQAMQPNLKSLVNATGIVVHTNLGRSLLACEALENIGLISGRYSNLEFDLKKGKRGSRYSHVEEILCEISGGESAMVVNNNAGAVLISLETLARGKKVIVSRGELVEIGGSFRIPDVMVKSGCILCEVGTTNRTHLEDYRDALDEEAALILKVHKSNYSVVGFSSEVPLKELVALGNQYGVPVMEDLGSGTFIDFSKYGLIKEPTVQESVSAGVNIVTFSGDKLLGGPQSGLIVGDRKHIDLIKKNPINRAMRIDKMTLAALESTLRLYRDEAKAVQSIPTLRMMLQPIEHLENKAARLQAMLESLGRRNLKVSILNLSSRPGGGSLPLLELPSKCLGVEIEGLSVNRIERGLRLNSPPIIGRIEEDKFIMDTRTIQDDELQTIQSAFETLLDQISEP